MASPNACMPMCAAATFMSVAARFLSISAWSPGLVPATRSTMDNAARYFSSASGNARDSYSWLPCMRSWTCSFSALTRLLVSTRTLRPGGTSEGAVPNPRSSTSLSTRDSPSRVCVFFWCAASDWIMTRSASASVSLPSSMAFCARRSISSTRGLHAHLAKSPRSSFVNVLMIRRSTGFSRKGATFFCASKSAASTRSRKSRAEDSSACASIWRISLRCCFMSASRFSGRSQNSRNDGPWYAARSDGKRAGDVSVEAVGSAPPRGGSRRMSRERRTRNARAREGR